LVQQAESIATFNSITVFAGHFGCIQPSNELFNWCYIDWVLFSP